MADNVTLPGSGQVVATKEDATGSHVQMMGVVDPNMVQIDTRDLLVVLKNLINVLANPSYVDKSANQMRAQVTGSVAVSGSLTTVSTVTTLSNIDGYQGKQGIIAENINAWSNTVRNKIT